MATATVTSKGQITLPKEVRDHLGLKRGDRVDFSIDAEGNVQMRMAKRSVSELFGFLKRPEAPPVSLEQIDESIARSRRADDEQAQAAPGQQTLQQGRQIGLGLAGCRRCREEHIPASENGRDALFLYGSQAVKTPQQGRIGAR